MQRDAPVADYCLACDTPAAAPLFQRGECARHELAQLAGRHPGGEALERVMARLLTRCSAREPDGCSLMATETSERQPSAVARMQAGRHTVWLSKTGAMPACGPII